MADNQLLTRNLEIAESSIKLNEVKISAESANLNQNYDSKKSKHSIFDKSSKVFNSLEMLKTSVSHKQKALDSQRNVNRKKL